MNFLPLLSFGLNPIICFLEKQAIDDDKIELTEYSRYRDDYTPASSYITEPFRAISSF
jgi:hypothetical protein